ncbi:hypothetical protein BpHYR1_037898 [Brachionus plicatilis]|uniref:Uncharacterized protein n=1 Tax=Brachionus plicatilis TaxID=10195 RepID=A0A3M7T448_BRAPC|nr:hypothetical protein BpHYR1_037898 [Brachionus plicatilis]
MRRLESTKSKAFRKSMKSKRFVKNLLNKFALSIISVTTSSPSILSHSSVELASRNNFSAQMEKTLFI